MGAMSQHRKSSGPPVHTTPNAKGSGWVNQAAGNTLSHHRTKAVAVDAGRDRARATHTEHVIHNLDGQIGQKNSYGNDPCPPKDTK
jgi:hypothetical protein